MYMTREDLADTLSNISYVLANDFSTEHKQEALNLLKQLERGNK